MEVYPLSELDLLGSGSMSKNILYLKKVDMTHLVVFQSVQNIINSRIYVACSLKDGIEVYILCESLQVLSYSSRIKNNSALNLP